MSSKNIIKLSVLAFLAIAAVKTKAANDTLDVIHYNINVYTNIQNKYLKGFTELTVTAKAPLEKIELDLWGLFVDSLFLNGKKHNFRYRTNAFEINQKISPEDTVLIRVYYHGKPVEDQLFGGVYFSSYDAYNYGIAMTSSPLSAGRAWFAANDIFTDRATFEFHITTDNPYQAVCNGLPTDTIRNGNKTTWSWKLKEPIPTYLANFAVGKYNVKKYLYRGKAKEIPVMIFIPQRYGDAGFKLFDNLDTVMAIYEDLFGEYPFERIGFVITSSDVGAMEHATNISLPYSVLQGGLNQERLIYHELAHSWFGNYTNAATYKDMWLNEGFASYAEMLYIEKLYGESIFRTTVEENTFNVINFTHIRDNGYLTLADIPYSETYGSTVYDKGAAVIHTLRFFVGDSIFFPALRQYLKQNAWSYVTTEKFQKAMEDATGQNLDDFFQYWLYDKGYPIFEIYYFYTLKKQKGKYPVVITTTLRNKAGEKLWKNAKFEIELVGKDNQTEYHTIILKDSWQIDTIFSNFKPVTVTADPKMKTFTAATTASSIIDTPATYIFDYQLCDIATETLKKPAYAYIKTTWAAPDTNDPKGYILQKNYYWTIRLNKHKKDKFTAKLYLTTLMEQPFTFNYREIKVLYREFPYQPWKEIPATLHSNEYFEIPNLQSGQYIFALKRN